MTRAIKSANATRSTGDLQKKPGSFGGFVIRGRPPGSPLFGKFWQRAVVGVPYAVEHLVSVSAIIDRSATASGMSSRPSYGDFFVSVPMLWRVMPLPAAARPPAAEPLSQALAGHLLKMDDEILPVGARKPAKLPGFSASTRAAAVCS